MHGIMLIPRLFQRLNYISVIIFSVFCKQPLLKSPCNSSDSNSKHFERLECAEEPGEGDRYD